VCDTYVVLLCIEYVFLHEKNMKISRAGPLGHVALYLSGRA
jgi:hypothetical protein